MRTALPAFGSRLSALGIDSGPVSGCTDRRPPLAESRKPLADIPSPVAIAGIDVLLAVTSPISLNLLRGQARFLRAAGFHPAVLCGPGPQAERMRTEEGIPVIEIPMQREIAPGRDLVSLVRIWRLMRRLRPQISNAGTPKAGLLVGLASWLTGVPCRLYTMRGLRFETAAGFKRRILSAAETVACGCAQHVICVSSSLRAQAVAAGVVSQDKALVLASGSSNGVDVSRFAATPDRLEQAAELRGQLGIAAGRPVLGFVGRLTRDKGVPELLEAFAMIRQQMPDALLLLVGSFESGDPVPESTRRLIEADPNVVQIEFTANHALYYLLMDVFVLPTHREGFPNAVLEAQAAGKPVVTTRATGAVDSVIDGVTGLQVPVCDAAALADAVVRLLSDRELAQRMGQAGLGRVNREFRQEVIWEALAGFYRNNGQGVVSTVGSREALLPEAGAPASSGFQDTSRPPAFSTRPRWARFCKRALDLLAGTVGMILLSPLLLAIAAIIRIRMGSPIFFRQLRPGYRARPFRLVKFRTMTNYASTGSSADMNVDPSKDAVRLTPLGRFLRRFSLDELPQLWNVVSGSMSLVGPRPLLMEYLDRYTPEQARRHDVKPGITGWTQINGRNSNTWEQKFAMDVWYVDHWSFWLDLRILAITFWKVVKQEGISQPGHATMTKFGAGRNP